MRVVLSKVAGDKNLAEMVLAAHFQTIQLLTQFFSILIKQHVFEGNADWGFRAHCANLRLGDYPHNPFWRSAQKPVPLLVFPKPGLLHLLGICSVHQPRACFAEFSRQTALPATLGQKPTTTTKMTTTRVTLVLTTSQAHVYISESEHRVMTKHAVKYIVYGWAT